ncbi:MAG: cytidine deaminase [Bdellovibrio sp.]|nr:MAG: cytidine deaminase [Bdellovibrio sp.]
MKVQNSHHALFDLAKAARANSYSPYSHFAVGSALKLDNGKIYAGTNIENSSFGATVCAERVAVWKALSENPGGKLEEVLVLTNRSPAVAPCGVCRQILSEFASPNLVIHLAGPSGVERSLPFTELFPEAFQFFKEK